MLFFANPKRKRNKSRSKSRRATARRKVRRVARRVSSTKGASMARRKRARRATARRRRRSSAKRTRKFSAVRAYLPNPRRRRRYRRNPVLGGGIVSTLKTGVKDGLVVLVSQAATKRAIALVAGLNPITGLSGTAINGLGTAVLVSLLGRKVMPSQSKLIAAASFAEGLRGIIAATPAAALFADYDYPVASVAGGDGYGAWPQIPASVAASGMGAWALGDTEDAMMMQ